MSRRKDKPSNRALNKIRANVKTQGAAAVARRKLYEERINATMPDCLKNRKPGRRLTSEEYGAVLRWVSDSLEYAAKFAGLDLKES